MPQILPDRDVLIVGAGPTGLTLACEAARRGLSCRLIEKERQPNPWSRALGVQARTLELFAQMGISDKAVAHGRKVQGARIHSEGRERAHVRLEGLDSPFPYILILPQNDTEMLLTEKARSHGVEIERGTALTGFVQDGEGVTATLQHQDGREETTRVQWLVGADGAHSAVRHGLGLPFEGAAYPEGFLLADCRMTGSLSEEELSVYLTHDGFLAIFPFGGGLFRLIAGLPRAAVSGPEGDAHEATLEECQAVMDKCGPKGVRLSDPVWISRFHLHRRLAPQMRVGRVFLAGDAAHIHSPAGGQGMNTGIQDAFNLAWKLALVTRGASPDSLLDSYHAERHPVAAGVLRDTDFAMQAITLHNPVAEAVRDRLLASLTGIEAVQKHLRNEIAELSLNYRRSPIVEDRIGSGALHAGDRVPDTPLTLLDSGAVTSLLTVLADTRHTLWLIAGEQPSEKDIAALSELRSQIEARFGSYIAVHLVRTTVMPAHSSWHGSGFLDPSGALQVHWGKEPALCLIRPDGYLAFRGRLSDHEALVSYLGRLFKLP